MATQTPDGLGMENGAVVFAMQALGGGCVAAPVPAVFGAHHGTAGLRFLQSAAAASTASPMEVAELVKALGGTAAGAAQSFPDCKLLDAAARSALIRHVDMQHLTQPEQQRQHDFRLTMSEAELRACVGEAAVHKLFEFFGRTPSVIKLRRVEAAAHAVKAAQPSSNDVHGAPVTSSSSPSSSSSCVCFHKDYSLRTMQVPLNE
jgi:hypothetical protein